MRIWDVSPSFLNNNSLLGEHKELHGIFNIITKNKKGYSKRFFFYFNIKKIYQQTNINLIFF